MNLVKAADDLKNLSDQQLMVAGQNPVAVPPYLVLAEMKRREQLRAEYAKAQQGQQQQQPPVAQQVAQNLMQGQQQPQQQQQPPAQGIMQAMPQGAMGMAGGGHVARYANKGIVNVDPYMDAIKRMESISIPRPQAPTATRESMMAEYARAYPMPTIEDKIASARALLGAQDYSKYEEYLRKQRAEAEAGRPVLGAAFTAGAREMGRFDPRETFAGKLARGIMGATEAIQANREQKKKDIQTAVLAEMAFKNMLQQNKAKEIDLASQLASTDRGQMIAALQMVESRLNQDMRDYNEAKSKAEQVEAQAKLAATKAKYDAIESALRNQTQLSIAGIAAGSRFAERPPTAAQAATDRGNALASDALMQAEDYLSKKGKLEGFNQIDLALSNLRNPNYFAGFKAEDRMRAASALRKYKKELQDQYIAKRKLELAEQKQSQSQSIINLKKAGLEDDDIEDAIRAGAVPR